MDINVFNTLLANYETRVITWQDSNYLVAPVVLLAEGVHKGVDGVPTFYSAEELAKFPYSWNGVPLPIDHPRGNDMSLISAQDPYIIEKQVVGNLWNVEFTENKLKGEIWIDIKKAQAICPEVLARLKNRGDLEVSTGLGVETENVAGEWNDETYERIVRNFRPDHLALLPDGVGACSIKDGCGVRANEAKKGGDKVKSWTDVKTILAQNELMSLMTTLEASYEQIRSELQKTVDQMDSNSYAHFVKAVYDDYFIYMAQANMDAPGPPRESKMLKQKYSVATNGSIELKDDPAEVREEINYITLNEGGTDMPKEKEKCCPEKVVALIANEGNSYTDDDKSWLEALTEEQLAKIEGEDKAKTDVQLIAEDAAKELGILKADTDNETEGKDDPPPADDKAVTVEEYIASAPEEIKEVLASGVQMNKAQKGELVKNLMANERNKFTKEQLEAKGIEELKNLADLAHVKVNYEANLGNANDQSGEEALVMPTMDFEKK